MKPLTKKEKAIMDDIKKVTSELVNIHGYENLDTVLGKELGNKIYNLVDLVRKISA